MLAAATLGRAPGTRRADPDRRRHRLRPACRRRGRRGRPGRPVLSLQADGSAMYTISALWTQARERPT